MSKPRFEVDREEGKLLGVCAGLAKATGVDATIVSAPAPTSWAVWRRRRST